MKNDLDPQHKIVFCNEIYEDINIIIYLWLSHYSNQYLLVFSLSM